MSSKLTDGCCGTVVCGCQGGKKCNLFLAQEALAEARSERDSALIQADRFRRLIEPMERLKDRLSDALRCPACRAAEGALHHEGCWVSALQQRVREYERVLADSKLRQDVVEAAEKLMDGKWPEIGSNYPEWVEWQTNVDEIANTLLRLRRAEDGEREKI